MNRWLLLIFAVLLSACAVEPHNMPAMELFAAEGSVYEGQATVYVMRDESGAGQAWPVTVKLDDMEEGSIRRETYVKFGVPEGDHVVLAGWPPFVGGQDVAVKGDFVAGKTYYLLFWTTSGLGMSGGRTTFSVASHIAQTNAADAEPRIHLYKERQPSESSTRS